MVASVVVGDGFDDGQDEEEVSAKRDKNERADEESLGRRAGSRAFTHGAHGPACSGGTRQAGQVSRLRRRYREIRPCGNWPPACDWSPPASCLTLS
jgi:hypothetical protein